MNKMLVRLQREEIEEIENYSERMNSLKTLTLVFESDEVFSEKSSFYEKLIQDISKTNRNIRSWWTKIIRKYELERYDQEKLLVDFVSGQIEVKDLM